MIGYKDKTFCPENCPCGNGITPEIREAARKWWGGLDAPIAVSEVCPFEEKENG